MPRQAGFRFSIRLRHERANTAPAGDPIVGRIFCVGRRFCESRFFRRNEVFPVQPFSHDQMRVMFYDMRLFQLSNSIKLFWRLSWLFLAQRSHRICSFGKRIRRLKKK